MITIIDGFTTKLEKRLTKFKITSKERDKINEGSLSLCYFQHSRFQQREIEWTSLTEMTVKWHFVLSHKKYNQPKREDQLIKTSYKRRNLIFT